MLKLNYPKNQSMSYSNTLFRLYLLAKNSDKTKILFNLEKTDLLTPFGMMILTATVSSCLQQGKKCLYKGPKDKDVKNFLDGIGFHGFFGLKGKDYKKVYDINTGTVQLRRQKGIQPMLIETLTQILEHHLNISPGVKESLQMSLLETMTNVVDHSGKNKYYVCCWNYPEKDQLRLLIIDLGIGIPDSLRKMDEYKNENNDHNLIRLSTNIGVSSRTGRAGLGLNHIKQFLKVNEGRMCIISGSGKVYWKFDYGKTKISNQIMKQDFKGTIVKMMINTSKDGFYFLSSEKDYLF